MYFFPFYFGDLLAQGPSVVGGRAETGQVARPSVAALPEFGPLVKAGAGGSLHQAGMTETPLLMK